jgi:hypothetical protein
MAEKTVKIVTFVPEAHADAVRQAMGDAGAGRIGDYTYCTWSAKGRGRFRPEPGANPSTGTVGQLEAVEEERIETVCEERLVPQVAAAIRAAHPYEEVPIDVYPVYLA